MSETLRKGIGAALLVNPETEAMKGLFRTLRDNRVPTIDPRNAHVTLIGRAETVVSVFSERDQMALNNARAEMTRYLSSIPFYELDLFPEEPHLRTFGRRLGIKIDEKTRGTLGPIRSYLGEILTEVANIRISNRDWEPHMTITPPLNRGEKALGQLGRKHNVPRTIHVTGHDTSEQGYAEDPYRLRSPQEYVNDPSRRSDLRIA